MCGLIQFLLANNLHDLSGTYSNLHTKITGLTITDFYPPNSEIRPGNTPAPSVSAPRPPKSHRRKRPRQHPPPLASGCEAQRQVCSVSTVLHPQTIFMFLQGKLDTKFDRSNFCSNLKPSIIWFSQLSLLVCCYYDCFTTTALLRLLTTSSSLQVTTYYLPLTIYYLLLLTTSKNIYALPISWLLHHLPFQASARAPSSRGGRRCLGQP